jgi:RNA polymerase sigma factor (sigma-70 family)
MAGLARNEIRRTLAREPATSSLETLWAKMDDDLQTIFRGIESSPLADDILVREETREMVNATMSQLPQHYREALEAKYVSRTSVREIAAARSASEKSIESLLTRARHAFRETFLALARNLNAEPFNP